MLNIIRSAWGWTGLEPAEVVATNAFGNVLFGRLVLEDLPGRMVV